MSFDECVDQLQSRYSELEDEIVELKEQLGEREAEVVSMASKIEELENL